MKPVYLCDCLNTVEDKEKSIWSKDTQCICVSCGTNTKPYFAASDIENLIKARIESCDRILDMDEYHNRRINASISKEELQSLLSALEGGEG